MTPSFSYPVSATEHAFLALASALHQNVENPVDKRSILFIFAFIMHQFQANWVSRIRLVTFEIHSGRALDGALVTALRQPSQWVSMFPRHLSAHQRSKLATEAGAGLSARGGLAQLDAISKCWWQQVQKVSLGNALMTNDILIFFRAQVCESPSYRKHIYIIYIYIYICIHALHGFQSSYTASFILWFAGETQNLLAAPGPFAHMAQYQSLQLQRRVLTPGVCNLLLNKCCSLRLSSDLPLAPLSRVGCSNLFDSTHWLHILVQSLETDVMLSSGEGALLCGNLCHPYHT